MEDKTIKLCDCNRTMVLDGRALAASLKRKAPVEIHSELCRREAASFEAAAKAGDCLVACTQEAPLFAQLAEQAGAAHELKFVNIRELAGWSGESAQATPKIAALLAAACLPDPEPLPGVEYRSEGQLLIIGASGAALQWAERLKDRLQVNVLLTETRGASADATELASERAYPLWSGTRVAVTGYLGKFDVAWEQENPIDLERCTRCNACIHACPEAAIDFRYQVDLEKCKSHRACVHACGDVRAIDFERSQRGRCEQFDLVLDLQDRPAIRLARPPQGYFAPGRDALEQALAAGQLAQMVGEFDKPKYFAYDARICAHSRAGKQGCNNCLDTCSTGAISADGDHILVAPHLCMGCGGCATVCPSGALTHAYPRVSDLGRRVKTLLSTYREAGGKDACILFHNGEESRELLAILGRRARPGKSGGLPARVIPLEVHSVPAMGMDTVLGALAYGASQVVLLASTQEADEYGAASTAQLRHAQSVVSALGYAGSHLHWMVPADANALERELWALAPATTAGTPASFNLGNDKRGNLEFALEHLLRAAPAPVEEIALAPGAPWGRVEIDRNACTLCMACVGACPVSALVDGRDRPALKFIERNCVQCGLCVSTCPEKAVALVPRLLLTRQAREERLLHEAVAFNCVRCGKPYGNKQMVDSMIARLGTHAMFAGEGVRRLQMCADCRVIDMMENKSEQTIFDLKP